MEQRLLHTPEGVRDIYSGEYARKKALLQKLHRVVEGYGYCDIETPTFEYFDVFSREIGTTPSKDLYKFLTARKHPYTSPGYDTGDRQSLCKIFFQ